MIEFILYYTTSRQCLHPISNEVQCDAKLHTTMVRFGFKSECFIGEKSDWRTYDKAGAPIRFYKYTVHKKSRLIFCGIDNCRR